MIRLTVTNMNEFLNAVNRCTGPVYLIPQAGKEVNLRDNEAEQRGLRSRYQENKGCLNVALHVPAPRDYLHMVFSTTAN